MKNKLFLFILLIVIITLFAHSKIQATSWEEPDNPAIEIFPFSNHDVIVKSEVLQFDFRNVEYSDSYRTIPACKVTAKYLLEANENVDNFQVAFLHLRFGKNFESLDYQMKVEGLDTPYQIYFEKNNSRVYDIKEVFSQPNLTLSDYFDFAEVEDLDNDPYGFKYTLTRSTDSTKNFFSLDYQNSDVMIYSNYYHSKTQVNNTYYYDLGRYTGDFTFFLNRDAQITTDLVYTKEAITYLEFYQYLKANTNQHSGLFKEQFYQYLQEIDDKYDVYYETSGYYLDISSFYLMVYNIGSFFANQTKEIEFSYIMPYTYNVPEMSPDVYEFSYFAKPSNLWNNHESLKIEIYLNDLFEYIVKEDFLLEKVSEKVYNFYTEGNIQDEFNFQISTKRNPIRIPFGLVFLLIIFGAFLIKYLIPGLIVFFIIFFTIKHLRKKRK